MTTERDAQSHGLISHNTNEDMFLAEKIRMNERRTLTAYAFPYRSRLPSVCAMLCYHTKVPITLPCTSEPSHERQPCESHVFCGHHRPLFGILGGPSPGLLIELGLFVLVLIRDACLDGVIWLRRRHDSPYQPQHIRDLVRWLPLVAPQHA